MDVSSAFGFEFCPAKLSVGRDLHRFKTATKNLSASNLQALLGDLRQNSLAKIVQS
ncbi:hypothetical protein EYZ11_006915 [Aspergillus tanneri]|uniref:Uncharacterized protein n=1 Tax=Aspergillus tanneri TaxID=1220188 RepID=A0A4S3JEL0_9EURO|nr:hypothetical protein EYZ11_006915 [Aspergillus tanneri]